MPFGTVGRSGPGMRQVVGFGDPSTGRGTFGAKTPEPMATKIGRGDSVLNIYPRAKLHNKRIRGFCPPHMQSCLSNVHSVIVLL